MKSTSSNLRRGIVLPLIAVSLIALVGLVALAVDFGRLALAQTECQNAADSAAIAGARSLDATQNLSLATTNATNAAVSCPVLGGSLQSSEIDVQHGAYHYDATNQVFSSKIPAEAPDIYNLTQVTITHNVNLTFGRVFGKAWSTITVTAQAAHRPRDIAIVLDYSGSMNNESDLWNCESYLGSMQNTPNNTDPVIPKWGPYAPSYSPLATLQCTSSDPRVGFCNVTKSVVGIPALVGDFYSNSRGASGVSAFSSAGTATSAPISGDSYLTQGGVTIRRWSDYSSSASSQKYGSPFSGYTQGPGYWGKTFFIWPPNPDRSTFPSWGSASTGWDWRKLYFLNSGGSAPVISNLSLWTGAGGWNDPPGNYRINYKAILAWIKSSPNPFPSQLRAGGILYYSSIPNDVPSGNYNHTTANSTIANADQRFWKEYIDFVLGVWRDPLGNIQHPGNPSCSMGPDFKAATGQSTFSSTASITGPDGANSPYINANDNPLQPRHRFWFGPMTMIQYMLDTGILPGTAHDVSMVSAKLGIAGALQDIQQNHPNDLVSLIMFARPHYSGEPSEVGDFPIAQVPLSNDYAALINALWYPPNTGTDVRPWDTNGLRTPRAHGDYNANTATDYGFMLAYNQFSGNQSLISSGDGGLGRKGAQKIVILETDGMANQATNAGFTSTGSYQSYYNVGNQATPSTSGTSPSTSVQNVATQICALDTASPPGFKRATSSVEIHTLAFGAVFESTAAGSEQANAVALLQALSSIGGTTFPSSATDPNNGYKWCVGTQSDRETKLQTAFTKILDETESIILVK